MSLLISPGCSDPGGPAAVDGSVDPPDVDAWFTTGPAHLILSEVAVTITDREFVEIFNPSTETIDLTNYYLSDDNEYALLPGAFASNPIFPNITGETDFILKFPDGASIAPDEAQVVAFHYLAFEKIYDVPPDYGVNDAPPESAMIVPHPMVVGPNPQLKNDGEPLALFYWDGASDLVQDIDLVQLGGLDTATYNMLSTKSGVAVDGPDDGDVSSLYNNDLFTITVAEAGAENRFSHKRIALEDGFERRGGAGNGLFGDDETSEDVAQSWDNSATWTMTTPGAVHPNLRP